MLRFHSSHIVVVPSEIKAGCFDWIIRAPDGRSLQRSPYAFATREAAQLSGACWNRELGRSAGASD